MGKKNRIPFRLDTLSGDIKYPEQTNQGVEQCMDSAPHDATQQQEVFASFEEQLRALESEREALEAERKLWEAERRRRRPAGAVAAIVVLTVSLVLMIILWQKHSGTSAETPKVTEVTVATQIPTEVPSKTLTQAPTKEQTEVLTQAPISTPAAVVTAAGTLSKGKLHDWVNPQQVVELNIQNTLKSAPSGAIDLSEEKDGSVLGWMEGGTLIVAGEGGVKAPQDCSYLLSVKNDYEDAHTMEQWDKLERVNGGAWLDTSGVTDMSNMFRGCISLTEQDVSHWDTSSVTDMSDMFWGCTSLIKLDVSHWDTSNVTDMGKMFYLCTSLTELDVSRWDTSSVTDMKWMFWDCTALTKLDVSCWDTSKVADAEDMFYGTRWESNPPHPCIP